MAKGDLHTRATGFPILMTSGNNVGNVTARKEHQHGLPVSRGRRARAVAASMRTPSAYTSSRAPRSAPLGAFAPFQNGFAVNLAEGEILASSRTPHASSLETQMIPSVSTAAARLRANVPKDQIPAIHSQPGTSRWRRSRGAQVLWRSGTNLRGNDADTGWQKPVDWQGGLRG